MSMWRATLITAALMCLAQIAHAWGAEGHRLVGQVADLDLSTKTRLAVTGLMGGNPSLASVSTWMDEVRREPEYDYMKSWHFVNIEVCDGTSVPCPGGNCVTDRITWAIGELKSQDRQRQVLGLKVLVHLVGDIHQPLHAGDNGDQGGNQVTVTNRQCGRTGCELHAYWDNSLVKLVQRGVSAARLAQAIHDATPALSTTDSEDPKAWALESEQLAKTVAYRYPGFACGQLTPATLDADYDGRAVAVVRSQISKAGKRLARLLNTIFDGNQN